MKGMSLHHRALLALAICGASAGVALADPSDGPFASVTALVAYWQGQEASQAFAIFYNGDKKLEYSGFGPPFFKQYFQCSDGIRPQCSNIGGGSSTAAYLENTFGANKDVYLDNVLVRAGSPGTLHIITCPGDVAFDYPATKYYVVTDADDGFSPPLYGGGHCF